MPFQLQQEVEMSYCGAYCPHGGICTLEECHDGDHNSYYCTWSDKESLTESEADELIADKLLGDTYLTMKKIFDLP
jgi:hypothetical protein